MNGLVPWNMIPKGTDAIPIAIISLNDAADRRESLIESGFPPEWVRGYWPATDMRNTPQEEVMQNDAYIKMKKTYGRDILPGEMGCLFSHRSVINWFAEHSEASLLVIFEDDVIPMNSNSYNKLAALTSFLDIKAKSGSAFMCHLGPRRSQWEKSFSRKIYSSELRSNDLGLYYHFKENCNMWLAHAYIISKEAAIRYSRSSICPDFLADDWNRITRQSDISFLSVVPGLFTQTDIASSSIDPGGLRAGSSSNSNSAELLSLFDKLEREIKSAPILKSKCRIVWKRIRLFFVVCIRNIPKKWNPE